MNKGHRPGDPDYRLIASISGSRIAEAAPYIGSDEHAHFVGRIDEVRITKGFIPFKWRCPRDERGGFVIDLRDRCDA
jgi:hypothetical protein